MNAALSAELSWVLLRLIEFAVILRILLRRHRQPESRVAWVVVVASLPLVGVFAYLLLGEVRLGSRHLAAVQRAVSALPELASFTAVQTAAELTIAQRHAGLFDVGRSISGFGPVAGNQVLLTADSTASIDALVADIDSAQQHVHLLFYIWLDDNNGGKVAAALQRAVARGVECRAMVDGLGSRAFIKSPRWRGMHAAGVRLAIALPLGIPLLRSVRGRVDLRNHRKLAVIDSHTAYCGSQNCADPEFRVKPRYAPWVDVLLRLQGPIALQHQYVFATDWMAACGEDLGALLRPVTNLAANSGALAQVIATGPTQRHTAMPEMFVALMHSASRELTVTTPYYVPNRSMHDALCASAYRGVNTTLILPARNDSWFVAGASRSYYPELLDAGVHVWEFNAGLLHAKTLTVDGELSLIGSANMDRRSFELNFENNVLIADAAVAAALHARQLGYRDAAQAITQRDVARWSLGRRLWNNVSAMLSPIL